MVDRRQYESLRRYFGEKERAEMHESLVQRVGDVKELRAGKAQSSSTINAAIKSAEKSVWDLQEKLATGYEVIEVEVIEMMDMPTPGQKQILRVDTNEVLRTELMTAREKQGSFGFGVAGEDS